MADRSTGGSRLSVALRLIDGANPAYLAAAAAAVVESPWAQVVVVVAEPPRPPSFPAWRRHLQDMYDHVERRLLRGDQAALRPSALHPALSALPWVRRRSAELLQMMRPDVLIDLVPWAEEEPLPTPPAGRWQLGFSSGQDAVRMATIVRPDVPYGLVESSLMVRWPDGTGTATERGMGSLRRVGFAVDRDAAYWRAARLPARRLARSSTARVVDSASSVEGSSPVEPSTAVSLPPLADLALVIARKVADRARYRREWFVMVRERGADGPPPKDLTGFVPIRAPRGRFYADPFVTHTDAGVRIYVEDCPAGRHRGRISVLARRPDGQWAHERVVLDDTLHRAYPHTLTTPSGLLLSPDAGRGLGVDMFMDEGGGRALKRLGRVLETLEVSDPTVWWHDGRFWLFVSVAGTGMATGDELHLFWSTGIMGPWEPHPRNPIVADIRSARGAGRIFRSDGRWIRPGQDCSVVYGARVTLNAIEEITTTSYRERRVGSIEASGMVGVTRTHTYTFAGDLEALDGYRQVPRWPFGWRERSGSRRDDARGATLT